MAVAGIPLRLHFLPVSVSSCSHRSTSSPFVVSASPKKLSSSSTNRKKNNSPSLKTPTQIPESEVDEVNIDGDSKIDDGFVMPVLPGENPDFWEGPQWDALGFFVQYMWAFSIVFALVACGIAVATYNEGATDFKETPVYKESLQTRELLEEPDASNSQIFDANPTEEAPSLE